MTVYLDTSVILRWVLGQSDALAAPDASTTHVVSHLVTVECLRTLDRLHRQAILGDDDHAERRGVALRILERCEGVRLYVSILRRAGEPFPTPLRTLDALHLATALRYREARGTRLVFATHDSALARAAWSLGFDTVGT